MIRSSLRPDSERIKEGLCFAGAAVAGALLVLTGHDGAGAALLLFALWCWL